MSYDKEHEIRRQFLDEAQSYVDSLDHSLLGLAHQRLDGARINAALRAAHSIKGGAALMGYDSIARFAHPLEDALKVLKLDKSLLVDDALEALLLRAIDCIRQLIELSRTPIGVAADWVESQVEPIFAQLHDRLGDPQDEDAHSVLSPEDGQDILPLLFESEVEGCLQRLEAVLEDPQQPCLREELGILAQELGGLGEMLQLPAFSQLCAAVTETLESTSGECQPIAHAALRAWRTTQTLVLAGQLDSIPTQLAIGSVAPVAAPVTPVAPADLAATEDRRRPPRLDELPLSETPVTDFKILDPPSATPPPVSDDQDGSVRVAVRQLHRLNDLVSELTIERNGLDLVYRRLRSLSQALGQRLQALEQEEQALHRQPEPSPRRSPARPGLPPGTVQSTALALSSESSRSTFDSLELDRYSDQHWRYQSVVETIVQLQELASDIDYSLDEADQMGRNLGKTSKQLQTTLTQMRMRPLSEITDRFPRALREWGLQTGKAVRLDVEGGSTLIDRSLVELLHDPLMHLVRNAFDHGIEARSIRLQRGKPGEGVISIRAFHQSARTIIQVHDDGGGIALDKVRARAFQMGLDPLLLDSASEADLLSLIFEPGFSTSEQVSALSGRGVGMDVVREHLKQLRGDISVHTEAGGGTTFTLSLPLTLSTARVLLVEAQGMLLAIPSEGVQEVGLLEDYPLLPSVAGAVVRFHDSLLPLLPLEHWFHFALPRPLYPLDAPPTIAAPALLVLRLSTQSVGVRIERSWGEQEVALRRVESSIPLPSGFCNCTVLGDGRVVPLLQVHELMQAMARTDGSHVPAKDARVLLPPTLVLPPKPAILVVEDSINVRRFLALTLERAGYRVEQAKDGLDGLERLRAGVPVDAVICDVEMPRLDGFGLLAQLKADGNFAHLPVTMLTSRSGDKHRQLAFSLGAAAYFAKPFNEHQLLRTLHDLLDLPLPHAQV